MAHVILLVLLRETSSGSHKVSSTSTSTLFLSCITLVLIDQYMLKLLLNIYYLKIFFNFYGGDDLGSISN